ncbi:MAG: cytidine deaminase [Endozoicomonas sp.]
MQKRLALQEQAVFQERLGAFPAEAAAILQQIPAQAGHLEPGQVNSLLQIMNIGLDELMKALLPLASALSVAPISSFFVGAVVEGGSGTLYLGTNLEFENQPLKVTVHAEQFAVCNAWHRGEQFIRRLAVNEAPCGHCRQFLNELNGVENLQVIIERKDSGTAKTYKIGDLLPDAFGPSDLGFRDRLMSEMYHAFDLPKEIKADSLASAAAAAAASSYAPVCHSRAGVALKLSSGTVVTGRYGANAAFNPGISAMESAIVNWRLRLLENPDESIVDAVLVEQEGVSSQKDVTFSFLSGFGIEPRYYRV